jgi:outer membrane receptor protein involved in Fe transport
MVKAVFSILFFLFCIQNSLAQTIQIIDKENNLPIEDVLIYDGLGSQALSNPQGFVNISNLSNGLITFQHIGYETFLLPKVDIKKIIYLVPTSISVDEVVVSANKWEEDISEIPVTVAKISREDIALKNPQTAADILSQSGEVFVQKSQLGGGSPMIRGFAANSVLISVDGVRLNNAIYRSGNLQNIIALDGLTTESAEVVFGPGSVIYGSDALGGVMDFHTISPKFNNTSGEVFGRISSANLEKTGHLKLNIGGKKLAFIGALTYSNFDDLVTGSVRNGKYPEFGKRPEYIDMINGADSIVKNSDINKQVFSGYNQFNTLAKLNFAVSDNMDISYAFQSTSSSDIPRYDRLTEYKNDTLKYAQWYYGPQKWVMHHLQLKSTRETNIASTSKFTAALQQVEESRHDRKLDSDELRHRTENVFILNMNYDAFKELYTNTFYYGMEAVYNKVKSIGSIENIATNSFSPAATRYPDGGSTWMSFAAYANLKHYFSTSLILNTGIRYSQTLLESKFVDKSIHNFPYDEININAGAANGSVGLVWKISNELNIKSSISSGFRAPNVDDVGKVFDSEPGNVVVPNEDLEPEFSYSGEVTVYGKINYQLEYSFTGYYTRLVNAMVRRNFSFNGQDSLLYDGELSNVQALVNTGKAFIGGLSGKVNYTNGPFSVATTLSYTTGRDLIDDVPLRHTAPLFGQTTVGYNLKSLNLVVTQQYNGSKTFDQLAPSEQNKPHIYTPDGSPFWTITSFNVQYKINDVLMVNGGVENIFNVHYRPYSSGISAPGRNFIISMKASFTN